MAASSLKQTNQTPLSPARGRGHGPAADGGRRRTVWDLLTAISRTANRSRSLGDTIQLGAAELILRTTVPRQFTNGQHPFDYCNVANNWMRTATTRTSRASFT